MAPHHQIKTVETNSFSMDYLKFGRGERALVIIPGLSVQSVMLSASDIAKAYQLLADDFTIYVFDRRKQPPATYPIREMARDTAEAIQALGLGHVAIMGASQGGMIAMAMAIEQPDLVSDLVLCSTTACETKDLRQTIERWVQLAKAGNTRELYLDFGEAIFPKRTFEQLRALLIESAKSVTDEDLDRFVILAEGIKGFDVSGDLDKISCPVLLVGSEDDQVVGADATRQIAERLGGRPDFELHMYDGYGHAAYDTAPDFKERVFRFLTQVA